MSQIVDEYIESSVSSPSAVVGTLKMIAVNDPLACSDIAQAIKKKIFSHVEADALKSVNLLDVLMDQFDLTFHQVVHDKAYLSFLEKVVTREDDQNSKCKLAVLKLFEKWMIKFSKDLDIFPNFAVFYNRLVEQGLAVQMDQPTVVVKSTKFIETAAPQQAMDQYLINEAEGQDPEEFKLEVAQTLKLFNDVYSSILSTKDDDDRREALISLAANLDRYSEQFGLWIEQLDPGPYMEEAMHLNDQVTDALQRYKLLRSGALDEEESSSGSSDSSD